jgi:methyl-accepting chemotaxis protein
MATDMTDERLQRANAALNAYGAGIREVSRVAQDIVAPIRAKGGSELGSAEDRAVVDAMTKIIDAITAMLDNVGKALNE